MEPLEEGVRLLNQAGEPVEAARHQLTLGRCYWERSDPRLARAEYEQALGTLRTAGPSRDLALAYIRLSGLHVFDHDPGPARQLAEMAISTAEAADADDMRIWALNFLGVARAYEGGHLEGIQLLEQSAQEALERGLYNIAGNALHNLFGMYLDAMQMDKLRDLVPRLEAIKVERWATLSGLFVASVWANQSGEVERGLKLAQELHERAASLGDRNVEDMARTSLAVNYLELARYDEAREHMIRPSADAQAQDSLTDAWVWMRIHLAIGDVTHAVEGAEFLLTMSTIGDNDDCAVAAVETFLAAGRVEDANRVLVMLEAGTSPVSRQGLNESRARIALAGGDTATALAAAGEAVESFHSAGMVLRELNVRLLLAEIHVSAHDAGAAETEFRYVLDSSRRLGLVRLERLAEEGLATLGIVVERTEPAPEGTEKAIRHPPSWANGW